MQFKEDIDFVIFYSERLKKDASLFEQQRKFLNSQICASRSLFANWKGKEFKKNARIYLKERGLI
ncbi:MAG: hypothetical protein ACOCUU_02090 [Nanoarchaeota archaeon]